MERIRELRKLRGWTLKEFGAKLGIAESTASLYESGDRRPKPDMVRRIANLLEVTTDYLLGVSDDEQLARMLFREGAQPLQGKPMLPVLGAIPAGLPTYAQEEVLGWAPADLPDGADLSQYYYLQVRGDSMTGAGIVDGSKVLIRVQRYAENGDIVACILRGESATLKTYRREGNMVALVAQNPNYQPILLSVSEFDNGSASILGVAVQVVTELLAH